jgi:hypothetical protein
VEHVPGTPAEFGKIMASKVRRYGDAIRSLGIKAELILTPQKL